MTTFTPSALERLGRSRRPAAASREGSARAAFSWLPLPCPSAPRPRRRQLLQCRMTPYAVVVRLLAGAGRPFFEHSRPVRLELRPSLLAERVLDQSLEALDLRQRMFEPVAHCVELLLRRCRLGRPRSGVVVLRDGRQRVGLRALLCHQRDVGSLRHQPSDLVPKRGGPCDGIGPPGPNFTLLLAARHDLLLEGGRL